MAVKKPAKKAAKPAKKVVPAKQHASAKLPAKASPKAATKQAAAKSAKPSKQAGAAKKASVVTKLVKAAKSAFVKSAPAKPAKPAKAAPGKTAPAKTAPAKTTPAKTAPAKTAPAKTAPAKTAPAKTAPAKTAPAKTAPAKAAPAKAAPAKGKQEAPAATAAQRKQDERKNLATPAAKPEVVKPKEKGKVMVAVKKTSGGQSAPKSQHKVVPYQTDEMTGRPILPVGYKPAADEEYMNPLQLEYFRQRLQQWRADLVEESKQTIENLKEEVRDIGDEAERATRETENSLELRTRDRYRKLIGKIDSTLKRVDNGEYGFCVDTGEEIGLDRMEARLTAERTIDAQERWEHLQKQMGD